MVSEEKIRKVIDDLTVKHGMFFQHIRECLRKITDTKEEYETLRDDIWDFMEDTKKLEHERLIVKTNTGKTYDNDGDEDSVMWTDDMVEASSHGGILYSGHNHPNGTCFQSYKDFWNIASYSAKYSWTIGHDGLMIVKNTGMYDDIKLRQAYFKHSQELNKEFMKKSIKELENLKKEYPKWDNPDHPDSLNYPIQMDRLFNKYISDNLDSTTKDLSKVLKKDKIKNIRVEVVNKREKKEKRIL